jgi:hypothetical protein
MTVAHGSHQGAKVIRHAVIGLRLRFNGALFLGLVGHKADIVFSQIPLLGWHLRALHGDADRAIMRGLCKTGSKFSVP